MSKKLSQEDLNKLFEIKVKLEAKPELTAKEKDILAKVNNQLLEHKAAETETKEVKAPESTEPPSVEEVGFVVPDNEKHLFHVEITSGKRYDDKTGKSIAIVFIQKFQPKEFTNASKFAHVLGQSFKVLHKPE